MTMQSVVKWILLILSLSLLAWLLFGFFGIQALFITKTVNEEVPLPLKTEKTSFSEDAPRLMAEGVFVKGDSTYSIQGKATVTGENDVRTLSLTDFEVTNGPDLFVYIVSAASAENATVKEAVEKGAFINIGALKGNIGNQNYVLPDDVALEEDSVISIWCRRFSRNFGAAQLVLSE